MALEKIKEQEKELKQLMIYAGRPGLWEDWQRYQAEARKSRRYAEKMAAKQREDMLRITGYSIAVMVFVGGCILVVYYAAKLAGKI